MCKIATSGMLAVLALSVVVVGCDTKPAPIGYWRHKTKKIIAVAPGDAEEVAAVTDAKKARVNYRYRLSVLRGYYDKVGNADRYIWAGKELINLNEAQWFRWTGVPVIVPPTGESLADADERLLVEYVLEARKAYRQAMENLVDFYRDRNNAEKLVTVRRVQQRLDPVRTYMYFFIAEAPGAQLRPLKVIPAADALYARATSAHKWGKPLPAVTLYSKQRQALSLFLELIEKYPNSTRSPLAAFRIGHIYREYFNEDVRAVMWYQRAWQWDPDIQVGARFQAAVVYDFRLQNHKKALELYRDVLEYEQRSASNRRYARQRILELTEKEEQD
jgi:tetratricopeptide (TPR) repeat protein